MPRRNLKAAFAAALERIDILERQLKHEIANCPTCKGEGKYNNGIEHILDIVPEDRPVRCGRCAGSRATLNAKWELS